jgi:hypothetical protein
VQIRQRPKSVAAENLHLAALERASHFGHESLTQVTNARKLSKRNRWILYTRGGFKRAGVHASGRGGRDEGVKSKALSL